MRGFFVPIDLEMKFLDLKFPVFYVFENSWLLKTEVK